mmetsp:Transcript_11016/g.28868  ORF Transcript_11016/g.28868 Transcript_11016/m.28868 type:complete len:83 (-) Transcript_11016:475-723(-)
MLVLLLLSFWSLLSSSPPALAILATYTSSKGVPNTGKTVSAIWLAVLLPSSHKLPSLPLPSNLFSRQQAAYHLPAPKHSNDE